MQHDPAILARLAEDAARATARLQAYIAGEEPADELIPLNKAAEQFCRSVDSMRRWAKEEGFGIKIKGVWFLRRSMLRESGKI